jgi:hypothetical protein
MKSNPSDTSNKEMSYKARKRETERLLTQLKILTPNARERWAILTTMLEMTIDKIKSGKTHPILLRPWEIDDRGHKVGSIRNAIDLLSGISPAVVKAREPEIDLYEIFVTPEGIQYLFLELKVWSEIEQVSQVDTLTRRSLEVIAKVLDELKRLLERLVPKKC